MEVKVEPGYESLAEVLVEALNQAQYGKGKERHADGEPFDRQVICEVGRRVGLGYQLGQSVKKIYESQRLEDERGVAELLGSINYHVAAIIVRRESTKATQATDKAGAETSRATQATGKAIGIDSAWDKAHERVRA